MQAGGSYSYWLFIIIIVHNNNNYHNKTKIYFLPLLFQNFRLLAIRALRIIQNIITTDSPTMDAEWLKASGIVQLFNIVIAIM